MIRIAISRPGGIGDALLLVPALRALRTDYPESQISLWSHPAASEWLMRHALIDIALPHDRMPYSVDALIGFSRHPIDWRREHYAHDAKSIVAASALHPAGTHTARWQYDQIKKALPIWAPYDDSPVRPLPKAAANRDNPKQIILAPGSADAPKVWPYFPDLARELSQMGYQVIIADTRFDAWTDPYPHWSKPFADLEDLITGSAVLIGNDSSPAHLAGLLDRPTIALFGPSLPAHWKPLGTNTRVLHGCPRLLGRAHTSRVIACDGSDCWSLFGVDDVIREAEQLQRNQPRAPLQPQFISPPPRIRPARVFPKRKDGG